MKTTYTNEQLQAAIDEACNDTPTTNRVTNIDIRTSCAAWEREAPARLALARALLDRLPEPTPPVVDGKTPGQAGFYASLCELSTITKWEDLPEDKKSRWKTTASAILAAFGGQASLEAGIKRMEAVPSIRPTGQHGPAGMPPLRGPGLILDPVSQPAEVPWIEWQGGECPVPKGTMIDVRFRDGAQRDNIPALEILTETREASEAFWDDDGMENDIIAYRVLKYHDGFGPQAEPDWKAKYEEAIDRHRCAIMALDSCQARAEKAEAQIVELEEKNQRQADDMADVAQRLGVFEDSTNAVKKAATAKCNEVNELNTKLQMAESEIASLKIIVEKAEDETDLVRFLAVSTLRPLAEAGDVPDGCVRVRAWKGDEGQWWIGRQEYEGNTHFADIRLPSPERTAGQKADDSSALGTPVNAILADIRKPAYVGYMTDKPTPPWTLPPPPEGQQWHRTDWTQDMLPDGWRPLLKGESRGSGDEYQYGGDTGWRRCQIMATAEDDSMEFYRTRRPLPTPPKLIPLDINDIRGTDEFKYKEGQVIQSVVSWNNNNVELPRDGVIDYKELVADYLRRQHGSNEWKPCTKEETK